MWRSADNHHVHAVRCVNLANGTNVCIESAETLPMQSSFRQRGPPEPHGPPPLVAATLPWVVLFVASVAATMLLKRRSLFRPGGFLNKRNEDMANRASARRKRRVRDLLNDPVLARDLELRLRSSLGGEGPARAEMGRLREIYLADDAAGRGISDDKSRDAGKAERREYPVLVAMNKILSVLVLIVSHMAGGMKQGPYGLDLDIKIGVWVLMLGLLIHAVDNVIIVKGWGRYCRFGHMTSLFSECLTGFGAKPRHELTEPLLGGESGNRQDRPIEDELRVEVGIPVTVE